ncbi:Arc family DNA-binding protein [Pseudovibrio denitrificans]|uniref:Arc family DNA-binding protein n=1 Tax=Pseudovibrio denitrificans TaxID=258256 RepID=UPI0039BFE54C
MAKETSKTPKGFMLRMPPQLHESVASAANKSSRSINAEIIARLEASFMSGVVQRLNWVLEQLLAVMGKDQVSISIIAEAVHEDTASRLERVFAGQEEAPFKLLDAIADYSGVCSKWLKHGAGAPFEIELLNHYGKETGVQLISEQPEATIIIRSDSAFGQICLVQKFSNRSWKTYNTRLHLSDRVGAGGQIDQAAFSNACRILYRDNKTRLHGYILEHQLFEKIVSGEVHPLAVLGDVKRSFWVDDWWDPAMFGEKNSPDEYWEGYAAFCQGVYWYLMEDKQLRQELEEIKSGH